MKYSNIVKGIFVNRPNRFTANVIIDGKEEKAHVKNTGRCRELLIEGVAAALEKSSNPGRKTAYSLIGVYKGETLVNMDSQVPNAVAAEALAEGKIEEIGVVDCIKREVKYKDSRFDIYYEKAGKRGFIEVKGVTLENGGVASFPDAPTARGTKHMQELAEAVGEGYEAAVLFLIQLGGVDTFVPNYDADLKFCTALKEAKAAGVKIMAYGCYVNIDEIKIDKKIDVKLR